MKGAAIQEFNNIPFKDSLFGYPSSSGSKTLTYWESPRLTTEYPIDGRPAGSDRGVCKIINGTLSLKFLDTAILEKAANLEVSAALYGEYAGISGLIQQIAYAREYTTVSTQMYGSSGSLGFPQFSTFANLTQNVFIRLVFRRSVTTIPDALPLDVTVTGSLMATAPR